MDARTFGTLMAKEAGIMETIKSNPTLLHALTGAGIGGLWKGSHELANSYPDKKDDNRLQRAISGMILGAGAGGLTGAIYGNMRRGQENSARISGT